VVQAASVKAKAVPPTEVAPTADKKDAVPRKPGEKKAGFWGRVRDIFK
jgi:hypothetical protein